ncbi:MAG: diguanylate cyclase [Actinomycetota bacterium]
MTGPRSIGVRGKLALLGTVPLLVALVSVAIVAMLLDRDADESLARAAAVRDFERISQLLNEFDGEIALLDAWSRSGRLQSTEGVGIVALLVEDQAGSAEQAWDDIIVAGQDLTPEVAAGTELLRREIGPLRAAFAANDAEAVADLIAELRPQLDDLLRRVNAEGLGQPGSSWAVMVELVDLRSRLGTEAVLLTQAAADGVTDPTPLLDARAASDEAVSRVERAATAAQLDGLRTMLGSEAAADWENLRDEAARLSPEEALTRPATIALGSVLSGADFVFGFDQYLADVFAQTALEAEADGQRALRQRDLAIALGAVILASVAVLVAWVGQRLARRIGRVSQVAERISEGELVAEPLRMDGRDEVAQLAGAMDDMVATLRQVNAQVEALAAGRTDDPSLEQELPGSIGRSLSSAIVGLGRSTVELQRRATHDALTGLLDRDGLTEVARLWDERRRTRIGVLVVDLDGFKDVNDELGHAAGDEVLRVVADRLLAIARSTDVVARLGGDEFVAVLGPSVEADAIEGIADRVVELVCEPIDIAGTTVTVGASVGWVLAEPTMTTGTAIERADAAMYEAKRAGKGRAIGAPV